MLHVPILRQGRPYRSIDVSRTAHYRTGEEFVELSQANGGLIRRDLLDQRTPKAELSAFTIDELIQISKSAAAHFAEDNLPLGDTVQSPQDYVEQLSATTGLPHVMARKNMEKIRFVLENVDQVLDGLTRNLDLRVLDTGMGEAAGRALSYFPHSESLGVVLPSNSPGVHSLWAPASALKTPLVLKPGSAEPWTPYRLIQAFVRAGAPPEAFSYYPTDHGGGAEILRRCGRGMVFGDVASTRPWQNDARVEVHGPGYSKIVIGEDAADNWPDYLDVMVTSVLENSGRSCVNASGIWVCRHARQIAEALAERLSRVEPRGAEDPEARIAPFANPAVAARISAMVDQNLGDAREVTAECRKGHRLVTWQGCSYLLPTIILCPSAQHPLANREFLFPFASVVEVPEDSIPEVVGPTLVVTAITEKLRLIRRLLTSALIGRLNLGPIPTNQVTWDQPHEGNLFEHLYGRRAFQKAEALVAG